MSALAHITVGLTGAARLVKLDTGGFDYFEATTDGFWRSFLAAAVVGPLFIVYLIVRYLGAPTEEGFSHFLIVECLAYTIAWLAFPVVMLTIARALDRPLDADSRMIGYLVAYNWMQAIQNAVYLPIVILGMTGALGQDLANSAALIALMWVLGMTYFVTQRALDIPTVTAAGIVVMDLLLGLFIEVMTDRAV